VNLLVVQRFDVDASHITMHPYHGWKTGREVKIGCFVLDTEGKQLGDIHPGVPCGVEV
jgi:hypothetical protein